MLWLASLISTFLLVPHLGAQIPADQHPPTFSVSVDLIKIPVSVFDEKGVLMHDLLKEDFKVYEDGIRQEIRSLGRDDKAVSIVLVIDTSATVDRDFKKIREAAEDFAGSFSKEDSISIITFDDEARVTLEWTRDRKEVRRALRKTETGLRTALYDAMFLAANDQLKGIEGRKAIILLTDGLNNQSSVGFREASRAITQSQATLYVVSKTLIVRQAASRQRRVIWLAEVYRRMFGEEDYIEQFFRKIEADLTNLAESTGGRCFFPKDYNQVPEAYRDVARDLKSKYYLTYISNQKKAPDSYHRIDLECLSPNSKMNYRKGYYHEPAPIPSPLRRRLPQ